MALPLVTSKPESPLPDGPPKLVNCFKKKSIQGASADERVKALVQQSETYRICGSKSWEWYGGVKAAREHKDGV